MPSSTSKALLLCCLLLAAGCRPDPAPDQSHARPPAAAQPTAADDAEHRIETDLRALADDAMQGRETATAGYDKAAAYVARRFQAIGLQPAGDDGGWSQAVPLLQSTVDLETASFVITHPDRDVTMRVKEQFLPLPSFDRARAEVDAEAVFVGHGVHAPELNHDDFAGLDLRGKIAVMFTGAPSRLDHDRRAFHGSRIEKLTQAAQRGAIGVVLVNTADDEARMPWARRVDEATHKPLMRLRDRNGSGIDTFAQLRVIAQVPATAADLIFDGSGRLGGDLARQAKAGKLKGFALPTRFKLGWNSTVSPVDSHNIVARLPGRDRRLAEEYVIHSAHLDHIGLGAEVDGDRIRNGALDNALGVAIMLETARRLAEMPQKPKRSQLFIALTAEEKGLLGSRWFTLHPTVPADSMVANINIDMPVLLAPSKDIIAIGVEHSSLQAVLDQATADIGVQRSPDPFPEESVFVRSDQYSFIRAGVPAVYLTGGIVSADGKRMPELALRKFMREHYHQPSDQADLPIAYGDAARMAKLSARIAELVGNADARPRWNAGDFFGRTFAPPRPAASAPIAPSRPRH